MSTIEVDGSRAPGARRARVLWSRKDVGDMFEGALTPLGASFCEAYQRDVHPACAAAMGLRDTGDSSLYYRIVDGHLYANVAYFAHLYSQTPLGRDLATFTRAFASDDIDVSRYANPYGVHAGAGGTKALVAWLAAQASTLARVANETRALRMAEPAATFARVERFLRSAPSDLRVSRALDASLERFRRAYTAYLPVVFNAFALHAATSEAARRWLGAAHEPIALWSRATLDARRAERAALREVARAPTDAAVARFVATFGAAGTQEMDLARPRWKDDPAAIRARARELVALDHASPSPSAPRAVIARASLSLARKAALLALVGAHAAHGRARARLRTRVVCRIWEVRALVYEVAHRLAGRRALASPDDIAYATFDEVLAAARGVVPPANVLEVRRRIHELRVTLPPAPASFIGEPRAAPRQEVVVSA